MGNKGLKEQPMFPETYEAPIQLYRPEASGLIFGINGKPFPYRIIQCHYDRSFRRAELPYRGTHVGGTAVVEECSMKLPSYP